MMMVAGIYSSEVAERFIGLVVENLFKVRKWDMKTNVIPGRY